MVSKKVLMWSTIDVDVKQLVLRIAKSKGICLSEYLRQLVLEDLDRRSLITSRVKHELSLMRSDEHSEHRIKSEIPDQNEVKNA